MGVQRMKEAKRVQIVRFLLVLYVSIYIGYSGLRYFDLIPNYDFFAGILIVIIMSYPVYQTLKSLRETHRIYIEKGEQAVPKDHKYRSITGEWKHIGVGARHWIDFFLFVILIGTFAVMTMFFPISQDLIKWYSSDKLSVDVLYLVTGLFFGLAFSVIFQAIPITATNEEQRILYWHYILHYLAFIFTINIVYSILKFIFITFM